MTDQGRGHAHNLQIDPTADIGDGCRLGYQVVVLAGVRIGPDCVLGHHAVIHADTVLAPGVVVGDHAVLGRLPRPSPTSTMQVRGPMSSLVVGEGCIIGTGTVVYAGTTIGRQTLVADQAFVREGCSIGEYCIIGRAVAVENEVTVGDYVKIQTGAYLAAYTIVEDHAFIAPGVYTTNDNFMGRTAERFKHRRGPTIRYGARVGAHATLLPGIEIGREAFVASGAVVTRDVPPATLVMGVPAHPIRPVPEREWVESQRT